MLELVRIITIQGRKLTRIDLGLINSSRRVAFGNDSVDIDPKPDNEDWEKTYFLAKRSKELLAFARIHNVDVRFLDQTYQVLGMATLVALPNGQGFGRMVGWAMRDYVRNTEQTGLAFCTKEMSRFYKRSGLNVMEDGKVRFVYPGPSRFPEGDTVYVPGKDGLIERMLENPSEVAYLSRPHW